jgi:hypothetical protein
MFPKFQRESANPSPPILSLAARATADLVTAEQNATPPDASAEKTESNVVAIATKASLAKTKIFDFISFQIFCLNLKPIIAYYLVIFLNFFTIYTII